MEENKEKTTEQIKIYTKKELVEIRIHWAVLFAIFFGVLAFSAMKPIIAINALLGYLTCTILAGMVSYFMSYTLYEWSKQKGLWVYLVVLCVVAIMLVRYQ